MNLLYLLNMGRASGRGVVSSDSISWPFSRLVCDSVIETVFRTAVRFSSPALRTDSLFFYLSMNYRP